MARRWNTFAVALLVFAVVSTSGKPSTAQDDAGSSGSGPLYPAGWELLLMPDAVAGLIPNSLAAAFPAAWETIPAPDADAAQGVVQGIKIDEGLWLIKWPWPGPIEVDEAGNLANWPGPDVLSIIAVLIGL